MADVVAHAKPNHDYHLVNPSPWPVVGSASAFLAAFGGILWMHHVVAYAPLIFGAGVIGHLPRLFGRAVKANPGVVGSYRHNG